MTRFGKFVLVAAVFAAILAVSSGMLLAYGLAHSRMVRVDLRERFHRGTLSLQLPVPAGLLAAAIDAAAFDSRRQACRYRSAAALHAWRPAARAACRALAHAPDGVLVTVESGPGKVSVVKRGDTVEVHVESPEGDVRVTTPAGLVWHLADVV
jgi:hypothetical protein